MTAPEPLAWLDALADTHAKATGGPWIERGRSQEPYVGSGIRPGEYGYVCTPTHPRDAAAIVAAHNAMPELLRLARERHALEAAVLALAVEIETNWDSEIPDVEIVAALRSTVTAALAGPHTADEEIDRG